MTGTLIGYTLPDRDSGYYSRLHGYRPGAAQDSVELDLAHPGRRPGNRAYLRALARVAVTTCPLRWAEALYVVTNAPLRLLDADPRPQVQLIRTAVQAQPAARARMRPVSVGDTVHIGGRLLACALLGWTPLPGPARSTREQPG